MHTAKMVDSELKATKQCHVTCRSQFKPSAQARNTKANVKVDLAYLKIRLMQGQ